MTYVTFVGALSLVALVLFRGAHVWRRGGSFRRLWSAPAQLHRPLPRWSRWLFGSGVGLLVGAVLVLVLGLVLGTMPVAVRQGAAVALLGGAVCIALGLVGVFVGLSRPARWRQRPGRPTARVAPPRRGRSSAT